MPRPPTIPTHVQDVSRPASPPSPPLPAATDLSFAVTPLSERQYDFYLIHFQGTGQGQCRDLATLLKNAGASVWYDMDAPNLTATGMEEGLSQSRNAILFLSQGVMSRAYCQSEMRWAKQYNCEFVGVKESDGRHGAPDFNHEKESAPQDLRHLLDDTEFIDYLRHHWQVPAMVTEILKRGGCISKRWWCWPAMAALLVVNAGVLFYLGRYMWTHHPDDPVPWSTTCDTSAKSAVASLGFEEQLGLCSLLRKPCDVSVANADGMLRGPCEVTVTTAHNDVQVQVWFQCLPINATMKHSPYGWSGHFCDHLFTYVPLQEDMHMRENLRIEHGHSVSIVGDRSLATPPNWGSGGFTLAQSGSLALRYLQIDNVIKMEQNALRLNLDSCKLNFTSALILRVKQAIFKNQSFAGKIRVPPGATVSITDGGTNPKKVIGPAAVECDPGDRDHSENCRASPEPEPEPDPEPEPEPGPEPEPEPRESLVHWTPSRAV